MDSERADRWSRREFVRGMGLAGAGLLGYPDVTGAAEPPPETTKVGIPQIPDVCTGTPLIVAGELLKSEGFADVRYVKKETGVEAYKAVASGELDVTITAAPSIIRQVDSGDPFVILAGAHVGCFELFGTDRVRSLRDLKDRSVSVGVLGGGRHVFLAAMVAHVGLDPSREINWITKPMAESMRLFAEGKIDAFMGFPPEPQELRAKKIGHVVVNTTTDKPWSQYFCCVVVANREFVRKHPIATKRTLRAMVKAIGVCAVEPDRAVRLRADRGYTRGYDYALQTMKELPYGRWREYNPEDTIRFYALRLHEARMIKSSPQKIIAQGTDWRFLNELKKELKG